MTPLHYASQLGHTDTTEVLLESWANPNYISKVCAITLYFYIHFA